MSVEHLAAVLHHSRATGTAKVIALGIANHAGDGGSWPSLRTLANYANVEPRNVRAALRRLEELGEIRSHVQAGGDHRHTTHPHIRPNLYEVLVACPEGCDGSPNHRARTGYKRLTDGTYERTKALEEVARQPGDNPGDNPPSDPRMKSSPPDEIILPPPDEIILPPPDASIPLTTNTTETTHRSLSTTGHARGQVMPAGPDPRGLGASVAEATVTAADAGVLALSREPCRMCGAPNELTCLRRQLRLNTDDRHAYDNGHSPAVDDTPPAEGDKRNEDDGTYMRDHRGEIVDPFATAIEEGDEYGR